MNNFNAPTMPMPMQMPMSMPGLMDQLKGTLLTVLMVKNDTSTSSGIYNMIISFIAISCLDQITNFLKFLIDFVKQKINKYVNNCKTKIPKMIINSVEEKIKSIINVSLIETGKDIAADAIMDHLTMLPHVHEINYNNSIYKITNALKIPLYYNDLNYSKINETQIKLSDEINKIENCKLEKPEIYVDVTESGNNSESPSNINQKKIDIKIYSYNLSIDKLRDEINNIVNKYQIKLANKLGNNIYYFNELNSSVSGNNNSQQIDYNLMTPNLNFTMRKFTTNRSFNNLFGPNIDLIRKRVIFFNNNKNWYDSKGIPYTLGIMMSGLPGTGKTSLIKCIANDLNRHIINVHLSNCMTKKQIENLFFSDVLHITQNGKTETYVIPINQRLYVFEDVDCQCDFILSRDKKKLKQLENNEKNKLTEGDLTNVNANAKHPNNPIQIEPKNAHERITLSYLLNVLDGVLETPGRLIIMSSNHIEKIDSALIRPGRIDIIANFGYVTNSHIINMINHHYDIKLSNDNINLINSIQCNLTPAELNRILLENFDSYESSIKKLIEISNKLNEESSVNSTDEIVIH